MSPRPNASCGSRTASRLPIAAPPQAVSRLHKPLGRDKLHRPFDRARSLPGPTQNEDELAPSLPSRQLAPSLPDEPNGMEATPITFCSWETTRRCTNGLAGVTPLID